MLRKILVIDDEPAQLRLVDQILTSKGYAVIKASSGEEGIRLVYENKPDLVLLDVLMPGIDGWQTCRCIREASDVPVIMLTARGDEFDKVHGFEMGADDYVTKPFSLDELLARIRAVLLRGKRRTAGPR